MIPADFIAEWRAHTRWATDEQVEQDLVLAHVCGFSPVFEQPFVVNPHEISIATSVARLS